MTVVLVVADDAESPDDPGTAVASSMADAGLDVVRATGSDAAKVLADLAGAPDARVAVVGVGRAGNAAAKAATDEGAVIALALLDAPVADDTAELLAEWEELPILTAADPAARAALRSAADVYLASRHRGSDLRVGPVDAAAAASTAAWVAARAATAAVVEEVTVTASDGWALHGTRWLPQSDGPVPGIVLLHSGRSDRAVFSRLERLLADAGFAVLNLDWRGRGRSVGKGTYFSLSAEERADGWKDAAAAFDHLASLPEVDAERLGSVGVIHGAEHAARAAQHDPRVKALVILTGYRPADEAEGAHLVSGAVEVLYVTSTDHRITTDAMRALYEASPNPATRYVEYPGGAIGYQLFEVDHDLEPRMVTWLEEVLA